MNEPITKDNVGVFNYYYIYYITISQLIHLDPLTETSQNLGN